MHPRPNQPLLDGETDVELIQNLGTIRLLPVGPMAGGSYWRRARRRGAMRPRVHREKKGLPARLR